MSESKTPTPTPEPVGFYCDHSDEEPGKRTHEGWEWTDEERVWTHQPTIVSSHAGPHEWDMDRRLCPRAVPVYAVDAPALLAERDRARADGKSWHDTYQESAGAVDEFFAVLLKMLPGAADEGMDAYDQIPRGIDKLKDEVERLRTEQAAVFAALRDALGTSPATLGQAATQAITALQQTKAERDAAREQAAHLKERVTELAEFEAGIKHLTAADGSIDMSLSLAHDLMRIYVASFVEILNAADAPNFVELMFKLAGSTDRYTVTIRRPGGETPGEVLGKVRTERDRLAEQVKRVRDEHSEQRIYGDCGHEHEAPDADQGVRDIPEVGLVCEDGYDYSVCRSCCCDDDGNQSRECAEEHGGECLPCPVIRALDGTEADRG